MASLGLEELPAPHAGLVDYIAKNPEKSMVEIMAPYRTYEAQLRSVFAQDRQNPALDDPMINVLPLFTEDTKKITTRARNLAAETQKEKECYIMTLPDDKRRAHGSPATVASLKEFQKNFSLFSEGSLADMDWSNVVAAGSSAVNCLLPVPPEFNTTKRKLREYYHEKFCPASDVDLFLYGLTHEEAIEKIKQIERAIRDAILTEVTVVRTKYAITIASQYPTRHVQIVLRVYKSISEILTGFDIDAAGGAYDGSQVYVTPRALGSFITQVNQIDLSRRSPSYENRLSKYSHRNFEVYWPELDRSKVDPTIFERSFQRTLGLARLLVLERLPTSSARDTYLNKRREERGRPSVFRYRHRLFGNIKDHHEDEVADWVDESDVSNYHTFTVPYGEKFHAKKIEKLCYTRDLLLNAEWNQPKEREVYLHRHPAFFGRVEDVIEDCCGSCPKPTTPEEMEVAEKEAEIYISGKISFMIDDPGRQQIGSFNPLTEDDWTDMAYVGNTARLCQSIVDSNIDEVLAWLSQPEADANKRDYTGRTPLHLAVMSSTPDVVKCLVDHGARLTARLADGRTALHLAAERGIPDMIKILMEKSIANEEAYEEKQDRQRKALQAAGKDASEKPAVKKQKKEESSAEESEDEDSEEDSDMDMVDDATSDDGTHSFATGSFVKVKKGDEAEKEDLDQVADDDPDFYKIDVLSWDIPCSPLHLAIAEGHEGVVKLLCDYGGDALLPVKFLNSEKEPTGAILTLALALSLPLEKAKSMAVLLLKLGATSSQADLNGCTAFHRYVASGQADMIDTLWEHDKTGVKTAINHLVFSSNYWNPQAIGPLHSAIDNGDSVLVLKLLTAGAKPEIEFETWLKAAKISKSNNRLGSFEDNKKMFGKSVEQPLIVALRNCPEPSVALNLIEMGADPNTMTPVSYELLHNEWQRRYNKGETALDIVRDQIQNLRGYKGEIPSQKKPSLIQGLDEHLGEFMEGSYQHWMVANDVKNVKESHKRQVENYERDTCKERVKTMKGVAEKKEAIKEAIESLGKLEKALVAKGGKTFAELHPDIKDQRSNDWGSSGSGNSSGDGKKEEKKYKYNFVFYQTKDVTEARNAAYVQLFEAAWHGDLEKIKSLTLQSWDDDNSEPPLKIAITDNSYNSPFSLAFMRGHYDVARGIADVAEAQYAHDEPEKRTYRMQTHDEDDDEYDSDEDSDACSDDSSGGEPRIVSQVVDKKFTIENIGQVSMQVQSKTKAIDFITWVSNTFLVKDGEPDPETYKRYSLWNFFMDNDLEKEFKAYLDLCIHFSGKNKSPGDEETGFTFPHVTFQQLVEKGKVQMLAEVIKRTGAGIPLDHLIKKSGVEVKEKPRYYQGLTVYGKKRKDWATAGRNLFVKATGLKTPPLLHAALEGSLESVEWFLSDAPLRLYSEFARSKAAREDTRFMHLSLGPGGFDGAVTKWLSNQNDLVLHCAIMAPATAEALRLVKYLIKSCPSALEAKTTGGDTPLLMACYYGRLEYVKVLVKAGANQSVRNKLGENAVHCILHQLPKADQVKAMVDELDSDLVRSLFAQRNNLDHGGETPLHCFISRIASNLSNYTKEEAKEVLQLMLEYTEGSEVELLNGAGDSCLHTAVMKSSTWVTKALLQFRPKLLYRENAVGRTAAEIARDRVTGNKFKAPTNISIQNRNSGPKSLLTRSPELFVPRETAESRTVEEQVWDVCGWFLDRYPDKRRLVSLNEANDVAKRLGEKYNSSRYFSVRAREDDDEEPREDQEVVDFAAQEKSSKQYRAWKDPNEKPKEDERPVCSGCGHRH